MALISRKILYTNSPYILFSSVIILISVTLSLRSDSNVILKSVSYYTGSILLYLRILKDLTKAKIR